MKVLGVQTSPNTDGLTASLCAAVLTGAEAAGALIERVDLRTMQIGACLACNEGWGICRSEARCIIEDDLESVREKLRAADAVVVSTPVYFGEVSEVTESFFDRLRRCEVTLGEDSPIHGTPAIGIAAAGGSGGGAVSALAMLERYLQFGGLAPFDLISVTRRSRDYRLPMCEQAGRSWWSSLALPRSGGEGSPARRAGVSIPPGSIEITRADVRLAGLPSGLQGTRIVQLTDLHIGPVYRARAVRLAVEAANACEPDVIVVTGDLVSFRSLGYLAEGVRELAGLRAPMGLFATLGNHDYWEGPVAVRGALEEVGVRVLVNEAVRLADGLWLAGVDDLMSGDPDIELALTDVPDGEATVVLSHNPTVLPHVARRPCLVLAGHTHGGQLALPVLGPRRTAGVRGVGAFMRFYEWTGVRARGGRTETISTYRYPAGWYEEGVARMYVSRGIGFSQTLPLRLNCPPEIPCFTLRPRE